ncbi:hypothetical protein WOLCODRAFT_28030 [Wolfiporia cocos MD-104 SS10]|uniref:Uncharacterized protein n=1 Tax=Wolfiporia cocos (strain MD-104) TaxID=742152 RepID=A0A2H3J1R4_WOLCO|nr:hypothetical protein WOLCODRAFT_28030 [Wolfiporia cocos MD-104 SS10]
MDTQDLVTIGIALIVACVAFVHIIYVIPLALFLIFLIWATSDDVKQRRRRE